MLRGMSLPRNMASLRKQFYFTLFYFTTSVFAVTNTILYWFVTLPHEGSDDDRDGEPPSPEPSPGTLVGSPRVMHDLGTQVTLLDKDGHPFPGKTPCTSCCIESPTLLPPSYRS